MISKRASMLPLILALAVAGLATSGLSGQDRPLRIFISVTWKASEASGPGR